MKLVSCALVTALLIAGCSKPTSKEVDVVKADLQQRYSPTELDGFNFSSAELSNREAYAYIYKLYMKDVDKYRAFPDAIEGVLAKAKHFQTLQSQAKDDSIFHKVDYSKVVTDTISSGVYIIDSNDKVVYRRLFK